MDGERMDRLEEQVGAVRTDLASFKEEIGGKVETNAVQIQEVRGEVQGLRGEVQELRGEVHGLRGEVQDLRGEVQDLRGEVQGFRGEVQELREEVRLTRVVQEDLSSKIQTVAEGVASTNEALSRQQAEFQGKLQEISDMLRPVYEWLAPKTRELDRRVEVLEKRDQEDREFLQGLRKKFGTG